MIALPYLHGMGVLHPDNYAILERVLFMCCIVSHFESAFRKNIKKSLTRIKESVKCLSVASAVPILFSLPYLKRLNKHCVAAVNK